MLLPFFEWCEATALGRAIDASTWLFPALESIHLLALSLLGASILIVDLRLLGLGLRDQPVAATARAVWPWLVGALVGMAVTGIPLFVSEAVKCYYNPSFRVKMSVLPVALLFTVLVRQRVALGLHANPTTRGRLVAAVSLALWFTVAAAGRWIGFSS